MEITSGKIITNETNVNARGGTELMAKRLHESIDQKILEDYQIIFSRMRTLDPTKIRLYLAHDLEGDPEADNALSNEGWKRFHKIIFVSNHQMQNYIHHYNIPFSHCLVMANAVEPALPMQKPKDVINIGYWSTPHRGLNILVPVYKKLCEEFDNIHLDVFSSFKIYGWEERDSQFAELIQLCTDDSRISYHGSVSYSELRSALAKIHILGFPSTWVETSCMVLMEAMTHGMLAVHSNLGALYETGAKWTAMYQYSENPQEHAERFYNQLRTAIINVNNPVVQSRLVAQKTFADVFYSWQLRQDEWKNLLVNGFVGVDRSLHEEKPSFRIKTS